MSPRPQVSNVAARSFELRRQAESLRERARPSPPKPFQRARPEDLIAKADALVRSQPAPRAVQ